MAGVLFAYGIERYWNDAARYPVAGRLSSR
jgi:hypothetical protein